MLIMSKKEMIVYDIVSLIFILLFITLIIVIGVGIEKFESNVDLWNGVLKAKVFVIFFGIFALAYTIMVLFLVFKKEKLTINLVFMVIGSFILMGILPFIYYFSHLRKMLSEEGISTPIKASPIIKQQVKPKPFVQPLQLQPKTLPETGLYKVSNKNDSKSRKTNKVSGANNQTVSKVQTKSKRK